MSSKGSTSGGDAVVMTHPDLAPRVRVREPAVVAATVYSQGAQVVREAVVSLDVSRETAVVFPMPTKFDRDSVQIRFAEGPAANNLVLRGVQFEEEEEEEPQERDADTTMTKAWDPDHGENEDHSNNDKSKEDNATTARQKELEKREFELNLSLEEVGTTIEKMKNATTRAREMISIDVNESYDARVWKTFMKDQRDRHEGLLRKKRELQKELEMTRACLQEVRMQLSNAALPGATQSPSGKRRRATKTNVIALVSVKAAIVDAAVAVSYLIDDCSWRAVYEVNLDTAAEKLAVTYSAAVQQRSEDNWDKISLALSTAAKQRVRVESLSLAPWRLRLWTYRAQPCGIGKCEKRCMAPTSSVVSGALYDAREDEFAIATESTAMEVDTAAASESVAMTMFTAANTHSVPRNGDEVRVPLCNLDFNAEQSYVVVPAEMEAAFARAECVNTSDFVLLEGTASIFLNGDFVTSTKLPRTTPGEKMEFEFGPDSSLEVKRVQVRRFTKKGSAALISRKQNQHIRHEYMTTITNKMRSRADARLIVRERIPTSRDDKLVVTLVQPPENFTDDDDEVAQREFNLYGFVVRSVKLPCGKKIELPLIFDVAAPAKRQIYGGV